MTLDNLFLYLDKILITFNHYLVFPFISFFIVLFSL
jgi:hypothetical protein